MQSSFKRGPVGVEVRFLFMRVRVEEYLDRAEVEVWFFGHLGFGMRGRLGIRLSLVSVDIQFANSQLYLQKKKFVVDGKKSLKLVEGGS